MLLRRPARTIWPTAVLKQWRRLSSSPSLVAQYEARVAKGELQRDDHQQECLVRLTELETDLSRYAAEIDEYNATRQAWETVFAAKLDAELARMKQEQEEKDKEAPTGVFGTGILGGILKRRRKAHRRRSNTQNRADKAAREKARKVVEATMDPAPVQPQAPRGLYIYGGVGAGKSMTMDAFFAGVTSIPKRRVHFHAFMMEVHQRLHALERDAPTESASDPVAQVADEMAGDGGAVSLLCFDEFLKSLFTQLLARNTVVVFTSNRPPEELNSRMISGPQALDFLVRLAQACEPWPLDSGVDYRRSSLEEDSSDLHPTYRYPLDEKTEAAMDTDFIAACTASGAKMEAHTIPVAFGRTLEVKQGTAAGVARFGFHELCDAPVGAADFVALAQACHTVFLTGVPQLSITRRNEARRFITLVDELYNHHAVLVCTAEVPMEDLFEGEDDAFATAAVLEQMEALQFETEVEGSKLRRDLMASGAVSPVAQTQSNVKGSLFTGEEERFAFDRALSRLIEMQSQTYRKLRAL